MSAVPSPSYALALKSAFADLLRGATEQALDGLHAALEAQTDGPGDPVIYELIASLMATSGARDAAVEFLVAAQARHPDLPLFRAADFRLRQRQAIARGLPALLLVTQFKSASVFLADTLAKGLDLPTCYVACTPLSEQIVPDWLALLARGGALAQDHLLPSSENLAALATSPLRRISVHIRDPRQSMVSAIHHYSALYRSDTATGMLTRAEFPAGFPDWPDGKKIDWYLDCRFEHDAAWTAGWIALAQKPPPGLAIHLTDFRTFRLDQKVFFADLLDFFAIPPAAFDWGAVKEPRVGERHFRKGEVAEWRRTFTAAQATRASALLPPAVADYFATPA